MKNIQIHIPEEIIEGEDYDHCNFVNVDLSGASLVDSHFTGCSFVGTRILDAKLNASVFDDCDFSQAAMRGTNLFDTSFLNCKLVGVEFSEKTNFVSTQFKECNLSYSLWRGAQASGITLFKCDCTEADWSLATFESAICIECDLSNIQLQETCVLGTDVRGSILTGWNIIDNDLHGLIITPSQCRYLIEGKGITIQEYVQR